MIKSEKIIKMLFVITGIGLAVSVFQMNENMIRWGLAYAVACILFNIMTNKVEREESLKYIRR